MWKFLTSGPRSRLFLLAAIFLAAVFSPSVRYGFIGLDDPDYVIENTNVRTGLSADNVKWAVTSCGYAENWHPLAWMSLQADASLARRLFGENPADDRLAHVMRAHNVVLHVLCCLLLMGFILRVTESPIAALAFGLLWAVHPLRLEIVCWVTERKELLCVALMLGAVHCWISRRRTSYWLSLVLFALALMAKPLAVTLPCLLLAWDWIVRGRTFVRSLVRTLPFFVLSGAAGALTMLAQDAAIAVGKTFSLWQRVRMTLNPPIVYLRQAFCPVGLSPYYSTFDWADTVLGVLLVVAMVFVAVRWLRRRERWAGACALGIAWCYVGLLPMLGVVKVGDQPHSDRYTYWIGCGFAALSAWAVVEITKTAWFRENWKREWNEYAARFVAALVAGLALLTLIRMPIWKNRLEHYKYAALHEWVEAPVRCYARILQGQGQDGKREAECLLREAIMKNDVASLRAEYAYVVACNCKETPLWDSDQGLDPAFVEAKLDAEAALRTDPKEGRAHEALGIIALRNCRWDEALGHLARSRELFKSRSEDLPEIANVDLLMELCRKKRSHER